MSKPKVLDLFCKAGGCSRGYEMAGFEPIGVDVEKQKRYPYEFIQADALDVLRDPAFLKQFAFIHASPPCQCYSVTKHLSNGKHPDLVGPVRELLMATGKPYVIENVVGAPLRRHVMLCGSAFRLDIRRHRLFESTFSLKSKGCWHKWQLKRFPQKSVKNGHVARLSSVIGVYGEGFPTKASRKASLIWVNGRDEQGVGVAEWRRAMGIDWMTAAELAQAIPPAYTRFLGLQIMCILASPTRSPFRNLDETPFIPEQTEPEMFLGK